MSRFGASRPFLLNNEYVVNQIVTVEVNNQLIANTQEYHTLLSKQEGEGKSNSVFGFSLAYLALLAIIIHNFQVRINFYDFTKVMFSF